MRLLPRPALLPLALMASLALAGCADEPRAELGESRVENLEVVRVSSKPEAVPTPSGEVRTRVAVTVVDSGSGPQVCVGTVELANPPECSGLPLEGWDWEARDHQVDGDVRWSSGVVLRGTLEDEQFTVTEVLPESILEPTAEPSESSGQVGAETPCPAPEGGWKVVDPSLTTQEALDTARGAAAQLEGARTWFDTSGVANPESVHLPTEGILNVSTTEDPDLVERQIRALWGGKLCVSSAYAGRAEVRRDLEALPGVLNVGPDRSGRLQAEVLFDDGSLAEWVTEEYGDEASVLAFFVPDEG